MMRMLPLLLLAGWLLAPPTEEAASRRIRLMKIAEGVPVLVQSETSPDDFRYLTGRPGESESLLLLRDRTILFSAEPPEKSCATEVLPPERLDGELSGLSDLNISGKTNRNRFKGTDVRLHHDLESMIIPLRMVKSPSEIGAIRRATTLTLAAHRAAARACRPGVTEAAVREEILEAFSDEPPAFPPVVASGPRALDLHYRKAEGTPETGDLLLLDLGATFEGYASDVSRTFPVDGTFDGEQRKLYDAVLAALCAAETRLRPGVTWQELHEAAADVLEERGLNDISFARNRNRRGRHFIGHSVGLSVHDPCRYDRPLQEGMVVTIEPGIYDDDRQIGIRIEDLYLITADGFERLSADLPREAEAVEKLLAEERERETGGE